MIMFRVWDMTSHENIYQENINLLKDFWEKNLKIDEKYIQIQINKEVRIFKILDVFSHWFYFSV